MKHKLPPLNWLRSFESAARHLSFTAAGDELALTQAAISQHVKSLEQYLGSPLFARMPRSLRLTNHGRAYHRRIEPALEQIFQDTEEIFGMHTSNQITLRVNVAFSIFWLAPRISDFITKHPKILVRINNPVWSLNEMEEGADLEIRFGDGNWPDLKVDMLTEEFIFPVCAPASVKYVRADLSKANLIHVIGYRDGWSEWCQAADIPDMDARKGMQCDNSLMAFHTAINGTGAAIARSTLVRDMLSTGQLVRPFEESVKARESFYLVSPTKTPVTRACETFKEWILAEAHLNLNLAQ